MVSNDGDAMSQDEPDGDEKEDDAEFLDLDSNVGVPHMNPIRSSRHPQSSNNSQSLNQPQAVDDPQDAEPPRYPLPEFKSIWNFEEFSDGGCNEENAGDDENDADIYTNGPLSRLQLVDQHASNDALFYANVFFKRLTKYSPVFASKCCTDFLQKMIDLGEGFKASREELIQRNVRKDVICIDCSDEEVDEDDVDDDDE